MVGLDLYYSIENKLPRKYHWFTNWYIKFEKLNNVQLNEVAFKLSNIKL
ncbi:hypothetical protein [Campylobacter ornithocola]|nr:hypothetical protein [Campylobacter ornithocola]